ncbi:MAG: DUF2325 domain-containing protein [Nitrosomonas sp.]|nr:DUF2325 domain-containing protein [Nitrosomonas sp.]MDP1950803.1 DUF2325 domain-containing protein [Nitrosomonas sp.]
MKFIKKLALDIKAPSGTTPPSLFLSICLRSVENLTDHLHNIIANNNWRPPPLSSQNPWLREKRENPPDKKVFAVDQPGKNVTTGWMPFIKATTQVNNCDARIQNPTDYSDNLQLAGRSVLCVGGRAILYPAYRHLVEAACGNFLTFHGNSGDSLDDLHVLLEYTDMVICPVDCVNHQAYFTVTHYCKRSGKPCALLDRSRLVTFRKGIETLASIVESAES